MSRHIGQTFGVAAPDYETAVMDFANAARCGKVTIGPQSGVTNIAQNNNVTADAGLSIGGLNIA